MTSNTHNERWSRRLGRGAGRAWRGYLHLETRAIQWLVGKGVPATVGQMLCLLLKLLLLGVLLYVALWLVFLLAFGVVAAWLAKEDAKLPPDEKGQWRDGDEGYGYYENGVRTDFGRLFDVEAR